MAITNGYCTLAEIKARLAITDTTDDAILEQVVEAVSRWIDEFCRRRFWVNSVDETRYYTPEYTDLLYTGDIVSITTLKTDEDGDRIYEKTWATTDYDLEPLNAALDGEPYTEIRTAPDGNYSFPLVAKGVQIVGQFGWPAVPKQVKEACLLQSERIFRRKDAPFGVAGVAATGELALIPHLDVDVQELLRGLVV